MIRLRVRHQGLELLGSQCQELGHGAQVPVAFLKERLDEGLHRGCGVHLAFPGHGSATVLKLRVSSLA